MYLSIGTAAPGQYDGGRGRNANQEERKNGHRGRENSSDEISLTREKGKSQSLKAYTVPDCEFSSFPEIQQKSA